MLILVTWYLLISLSLKYLLKVKLVPGTKLCCSIKSSISMSILNTWNIWFGNLGRSETMGVLLKKNKRNLKSEKEPVRTPQQCMKSVQSTSAAFLFTEGETESCSRLLRAYIYLWKLFCSWKSQDTLWKRHQNISVKYIKMWWVLTNYVADYIKMLHSPSSLNVICQKYSHRALIFHSNTDWHWYFIVFHFFRIR